MKALVALAVLVCCASATAQSTVTFTEGPGGTFPGTFEFDRRSGGLTVDLSGLSRTAEVFRAELVLRPITHHLEQRPVEPTTVHVPSQAEKKLPLVAPRFVSLDAAEAVRESLRAGKPLLLQIGATAQGVTRLEVSVSGVRPRSVIPRVGGLRVSHRSGQSMLVFDEPELDPIPEFQTGGDVRKFAAEFRKRHPHLSFRIYRSPERITPNALQQARLVGESGFFSAWNSSYHQDETDRKPPVRYRVSDAGPEVAWGTGLYAHNPGTPGRAFYAVTVCADGEEDLSEFDAGNTTAEPVEESVGPGVPVLQWKETPTEWLYRRAQPGHTLTRLIYTRWEAWPRSPRPNVPIDYLVVFGNDPRPVSPLREPQSCAFRVEPAPVGLHLHCWGGSLNGGYGWWYNAHRGAALIAANQVPYDWWTGHHEAIGTCKTWGDGRVHPFTMERMLAFLDWAATQWKDAPEIVRRDWRKLDLTRVFTAGSSMGGSGAPMFAIRYPQRVAWGLGWVGVHVPEESPQFRSSYAQVYGPRHAGITMPDGHTSPWDYFSDVRFLENHPQVETGFIIASNGRNDGAIGWTQAVKFARALQATRRPHLFNWGTNGHGTRTLIGANFDLDLRMDQSLPAFTRGSSDGRLGSGDPADGDPEGAFNACLRWRTDDLVDESNRWELTVILLDTARMDGCQSDLTPRRLQKFRTPPGARFRYSVTEGQSGRELTGGHAVADDLGLLTLNQVPFLKGENRVRIVPATP